MAGGVLPVFILGAVIGVKTIRYLSVTACIPGEIPTSETEGMPALKKKVGAREKEGGGGVASMCMRGSGWSLVHLVFGSCCL